MKLKQLPDDFQVEERTGLTAGRDGDFALYRLDKRGWTTPDALAAVRRRWRLDADRVSAGGLKDKHAHTLQHFTVRHGPRRGWRHHGLVVAYLGQVAAPFTSQDVLGNRFRVALRDLSEATAAAAQRGLAEAAAEGVPNYFDDQRFGSATGGDFVGRLLVRGKFEAALRLALTAPYEHDRPAQREEKRVLRERWGDWSACRGLLPPESGARSVVDHLRANPGDFRGACVRLRPDLRGLYLSAYQSHLWNRLLARWLERRCDPACLLPLKLKLGTVPAHRGAGPALREELACLTLPLPTARLHLAPDDQHAVLIREVLAEDGLELRDLQVRGTRELFFSKGERSALCVPIDTGADEADDDLHPGRLKVTLTFELPRGSYATLVVKRALATVST
jgi:tRNA pseudouridine13 synthase